MTSVRNTYRYHIVFVNCEAFFFVWFCFVAPQSSSARSSSSGKSMISPVCPSKTELSGLSISIGISVARPSASIFITPSGPLLASIIATRLCDEDADEEAAPADLRFARPDDSCRIWAMDRVGRSWMRYGALFRSNWPRSIS